VIENPAIPLREALVLCTTRAQRLKGRPDTEGAALELHLDRQPGRAVGPRGALLPSGIRIPWLKRSMVDLFAIISPKARSYERIPST